jgi:16S rRNA processing protein RimM
VKRKEYYPIGHLKKPFGNHGHVTLDVKEEFDEYLEEFEHVFLYLDGSYIPFFIEEIDEKTDLMIKLEEVNNPESASKLSGKKIYITQDQIDEDLSISLSKYGELLGFEVYDNKILLGKILEVEEYPSQIMIKVSFKGKEILLPLVDSMIVSIDNDAKQIRLDLPEGILELN